MSATNPNLFTTGEIAKKLGESLPRVQYVIRTRDIPHVDEVGIFRLYPHAAIDAIREALGEIDRRWKKGRRAR